MRLALSKFEGEHDFRNFCKMDIAGGVTNFTRKMLVGGSTAFVTGAERAQNQCTPSLGVGFLPVLARLSGVRAIRGMFLNQALCVVVPLVPCLLDSRPRALNR